MRGWIHSLPATCTAVAVLALAGCSDAGDLTTPDGAVLAAVSAGAEKVYAVTIENLTTGQPLSAGVFVTHTRRVTLFEVGSFASEGIRLIAEEGNPSVAVAELTGKRGVYDIVTSDAPVHRIGGPGPTSLTIQIRAGGSANRLSLATMLVCTNDGITGANRLRLPEGFEPELHYAFAYDAGTELNDELTTTLPDSCGRIGPVPFPPDGNARIPFRHVIAPHPGVLGIRDLVRTEHDWEGSPADRYLDKIDLDKLPRSLEELKKLLPPEEIERLLRTVKSGPVARITVQRVS